MSLEYPTTYGEWYWNNFISASSKYDEVLEQAFSPFFDGLLAELPGLDETPTGIQNFIRNLAVPTSAGFGGFALGVGVELVDETVGTLLGPIMKMISRASNRRAKETWLTSEQACLLFRRGKIPQDYWDLLVASDGYEDIIAKQLYDSFMPYPSIPDIMRYARYHGDPDNIQSTVWEKFDVPAVDFDMWEWLTVQKLSIDQVLTLYKRNKMTEYDADTELARIGWSIEDRTKVFEFTWQLPNAMLTTQGNLLQDKPIENILEDISRCDIHPDYAQVYLDGVLTKPSSTDIVAYELRKDPTLSNLDAELRKIGIHNNYYELYRELAYPIPAIADIITMAVREAFSPEIAARFGQYEDFPPDFERYAAMKGLSSEWAQRFWAAHWSLPSPSQGFEMLHRNVITKDELTMLLRAADVMPFWRDKLIQIAYRPLTRVDIRRMYAVGVLSESEVLTAYSHLGYDEINAKRMTDFTTRQVRQTQSKFTTTHIVSAFKDRLIDETEARRLLTGLGIKDDEIQYIIETSKYKRDWDFKVDQIKAIGNLYKKNIDDESRTRSKLVKINLPPAEIDVLLQRWQAKAEEIGESTWTSSQTLTFLKKGLISRDRAAKEFRELGYDDEHIGVYLASIS